MLTMPEYIEREELIEFVEKYTPHFDGETTMNAVVTAIKGAPAADVTEVVRCKECRSYNKRYGECTRYGAHLGENGFCSSGIRKEGAENVT